MEQHTTKYIKKGKIGELSFLTFKHELLYPSVRLHTALAAEVQCI
jgi:hypothetical protein